MKKIMKKSLSLVMALAVMITGVLVIPTAGNKAAAASPSFTATRQYTMKQIHRILHGKSMCRFLTAPKQHKSRI